MASFAAPRRMQMAATLSRSAAAAANRRYVRSRNGHARPCCERRDTSGTLGTDPEEEEGQCGSSTSRFISAIRGGERALQLGNETSSRGFARFDASENLVERTFARGEYFDYRAQIRIFED